MKPITGIEPVATHYECVAHLLSHIGKLPIVSDIRVYGQNQNFEVISLER